MRGETMMKSKYFLFLILLFVLYGCNQSPPARMDDVWKVGVVRWDRGNEGDGGKQ